MLVLRNGRVAATLEGDRISEEAILRAAVLGRGRLRMTPSASRRRAGGRPAPADWRWLLDRAPFLVACAMLARDRRSLYGSLQTGVFTLDEVNLDTAAAMTLMLAATGQTIVLIRGGIDLSIGGMISLGTVIAATRFGDRAGRRRCSGRWPSSRSASPSARSTALLISLLKLQPFLVTLATWSILSGIAMLILPTDGGSFPGWWIGFG